MRRRILDFAEAMKSAAPSVHLSLYDNETSHALHVACAEGALSGSLGRCPRLGRDGQHLPAADRAALRRQDERPVAGVASPAKARPKATRSCARHSRTSCDETAGGKALNDGLIKADTGVQGRCPRRFAAPTVQPAAAAKGFEVRFLQDSEIIRRPIRHQRVAAGVARSADEDRLGQCGADLAEGRRQRSDVGIGDVVKITVGQGDRWRSPAFVLPGQPVGVVGLALGYGRAMARAYRLGCWGQHVSAPRQRRRCFSPPADVIKTGDYYELATTQDHHLIDDIAASTIRQDSVGGEVSRAPQ